LLGAVASGCAVSVDAPTSEPEETAIGTTSEALIDPTHLIDLKSYWNPAVGDNAMSTNPSFFSSGYGLYRTEGRVFRPDRPQPPGTIPLNTWHRADIGDFFTTTNPHWLGTPGTIREGYTHVRTEGFVFDHPVAGTAPLQLWFGPGRTDNFTTADPAWIASASPRAPDYVRVRDEGFLIPSADDSSIATAEKFHYGTMGGGPTGARDLLLFALAYRDQPLRHSLADLDALVFGPGISVAGYTSDMSYGRFSWRRAGVLPVIFPDDPDTTADEGNWAVNWDPTNVDFLFTAIGLPSAKVVGANNGGGGSTFASGNVADWETMGLVDVNGGTLVSGDSVAFKTVEGKFLNDNAGELTATSTSSGFLSARFRVAKVGGGRIVPGDEVTLQSVTSGRLVRETSTGIDVRATSAGPPTIMKLAKTGADSTRTLRMAVKAGAASHFAFGDFDTNHDGVVSRNELSVLVIGAQRGMSDGAGTRGAGEAPVTATLKLGSGWLSGMGEDVSLSSITHELSHQIGTVDLYGAASLNSEATLMGPTIYGAPDIRRTYHLDPWHKMRLGWVRPQVVALNNAGGVRVVHRPTLGGGAITPDRTPILLYEPARYDVATRSGKFFMIEWREPGNSVYDNNVPGSGLYIWQCETDASGNILIIPHAGGGADASVNLFGAPTGSRGGNIPWTSANGTITLRYADGTTAGIRLRVGNSEVEWSNDGLLTGRLDSVQAFSLPGSLFTFDGAFPLSSPATGAQLVSRVTGVRTNLTISSWTSSRALASSPATLGPGFYDLVIVNGSKRSNPLPFELR
jgi:M6 family metalloprotease-like protein